VLALAVLLAVVGLRLGRTAGRRRAAAVVTTLVVATLGLHTGWVAPSVAPDRGPPVAGASGPGGVTLTPLTVRVLALNLEFGEADPAVVVDVVRRERVDLLLAVELTPRSATRLRAAGLETVLPSSSLAAEGGASGSGLWTRLLAEPLDPVAGTTFRAPRARLTVAPGRTVVVTAAHPHPPLEPVWWERDLDLFAGSVRAAGAEPQILGGDYNATLDHAPFRALLATGLTDAADAAGVPGGAWPGLTWPADRSFPPVMRLDHVLVTTRTLAASDVSTVTVPGTDHRGVLATVTLR
jgi:endonuclease/exonuclease/phosphatase (EEP) superfamily protein YafD